MMIQILSCLLCAAFFFIIGFCRGCSWIFKRKHSHVANQRKRGDKLSRMFGVLNRWMQLKEEKKSVISYLKKMGYSDIAIYGVGHLGKHLIEELNHSEIHIAYLIDKNVEETKENIMIYKPEEILPETKAIIVTAIMEFDEIADKLEVKVQCPIISIEEMIYEIE